MKIAAKIILFFTVVGIVLTLVSTAVFYSIARKSLKQSIFARLEVTAESRKQHVLTYLNMIKSSVLEMSESVVLKRLLNTPIDDPRWKKALDDVMDRLKRTREINPVVYEYMLIDADGKVLASSDPTTVGEDRSTDSYFTEGQRDAFIKDAYYSQAKKMPLIGASAPIIDGRDGKLLGVIVARITMDGLNAIVTQSAGLGRTGEVFIVNKDLYMITPSRFLANTFLKQRVDTENTRVCLQHRDEAKVSYRPIVCLDYRGVEILGMHAYLPEMNWILVTKIDVSEAFEPLKKIRFVALLIIIIVPLIVLIAGSLIAGVITGPIHALHKGAEIIGTGNLDYKVGTASKDEIGQLSRAFDSMTEDLKKKTVSIKILNEEISLRKKAEAAARSAEETIRTIFDSIPSSISVIDVATFKIVRVNSVFLKSTGLKEEDVIGKYCYEVTHHRDVPCEAPYDVCPMRDMIETGRYSMFEHQHYMEGGIRKYVEVSACPIKDENGRIVQCVHVATDITARKKIQRALEENQLKYKALYELSADAIMMLTPKRGFFAGNPSCVRLFGCKDEQEFTSQNPASLSPEYQPDGKPSSSKSQEMMSLAIGKGSHFFEWTHKRMDGSEFFATVLLTRVEIDGEQALQATVRDITSQMKAKAVLEEAYSELKKAQQKLVEAEKMSSLGRFAAGAAHEIKNPLGIIIGGIEYLQAVLKDAGDTAIMTMEKVKDAALRTNKIIDALVRFSEPLKLNSEKTRLNDLVSIALGQLSSIAAPSEISFATEFSDEILRVEVDAAHAHQAILNVLMNALDATAGRPGRITVRTREASPDELVHGLPSCVIEIIDTGEGIAITDMPKIFEPFFTTRRDKKQIGLGLTVARTLIRNNGGDIFVHSHKEKGTTAKIVLPLFEEPKDRRA